MEKEEGLIDEVFLCALPVESRFHSSYGTGIDNRRNSEMMRELVGRQPDD